MNTVLFVNATIVLLFLACAKVELWDLTVCIEVNGDKFQSRAVTLTLIRLCPLSNLSDIFLYTTTYSNFMFLDQLLFELSCKNTHGHMHTHTHTNTHTHRDSDEYSIVAFCKNATIEYSYHTLPYGFSLIYLQEKDTSLGNYSFTETSITLYK